MNITVDGSTVSNPAQVSGNSKTVANVKGLAVDSAKAELEKTGFTVVCNSQDPSTDIVVDQMPMGGAYLEAGSMIYLYTSKDEERQKVAVPNVEGKTLEDAISELKGLGLNVMIDGSGTVTAQNITFGTEVQVGTVITVTAKENASGGQ